MLYVNGDSNSAKCGRFWVDKLCLAYNANLINDALGGGSNPRILRTTYNFFEKYNEPTDHFFVIIGWTSWEREEWLHDNTYYQINASGRSHVPEELKNKYVEWVADLESISQIRKSRELHKQIFDLHLYLKGKQIKHLFFNALMPFQHEVTWQPESKYDWGANFLGPYDNDLSYYWFLKKKGYDPDQDNHHGKAAQETWADFLLEYIQNNGVFS